MKENNQNSLEYFRGEKILPDVLLR